MKWYHFVVSWIVAVLLGSLVMTAVIAEFELYPTVVVIAALCGSPTLAIGSLALIIRSIEKRGEPVSIGRAMLWHALVAAVNLVGVGLLGEFSWGFVGVAAAIYGPLGAVLTFLTMTWANQRNPLKGLSNTEAPSSVNPNISTSRT